MNTLELHIIQTFPPSRLNRGENGDPKSSVLGGVPRTRFSSQALKRAQRDQSTMRTKVPHLLVRRVLGPSFDHLDAVVRDLLSHRYGPYDDAGRLKTMAYLSQDEIEQFARLVHDHADALLDSRDATLQSSKKAAQKDADSAYKTLLSTVLSAYRPQVSEQHALFGRFMADLPDDFVDAATAYGHAISTHRDQPAADFYSAIDDVTGTSAHIGNLVLTAPTMYRFATLDLDTLTRHLGEHAPAAARRWAHGVVTAAPTGGKNGAFGATLPEYTLLIARDHGHPTTLANAFTEPAYPQGQQTLLDASVQKLKTQLAFNQAAYTANGLTGAREISVRPFPHEYEIEAASSLDEALSALGY